MELLIKSERDNESFADVYGYNILRSFSNLLFFFFFFFSSQVKRIVIIGDKYGI